MNPFERLSELERRVAALEVDIVALDKNTEYTKVTIDEINLPEFDEIFLDDPGSKLFEDVFSSGDPEPSVMSRSIDRLITTKKPQTLKDLMLNVELLIETLEEFNQRSCNHGNYNWGTIYPDERCSQPWDYWAEMLDCIKNINDWLEDNTHCSCGGTGQHTLLSGEKVWLDIGCTKPAPCPHCGGER